MSKGQYYLSFFLLSLCLLALPGFYRAIINENSSTTTSKSDQKINLNPNLQKRIPNTQIKVKKTTGREKKIITHQQKININTASKNELQKLPGIGSTCAQHIINHRETTGKFTQPSEVTNVSGIGSGIYKKIKSEIRTTSTPFTSGRKASPSPDKMNINQADQHKLQSLPGISSSIAHDIVKYRQENGKFGNLDELKAIEGIGRITVISLKKQATAR